MAILMVSNKLSRHSLLVWSSACRLSLLPFPAVGPAALARPARPLPSLAPAAELAALHPVGLKLPRQPERCMHKGERASVRVQNEAFTSVFERMYQAQSLLD